MCISSFDGARIGVGCASAGLFGYLSGTAVPTWLGYAVPLIVLVVGLVAVVSVERRRRD